jgi:hypothetical protein
VTCGWRRSGPWRRSAGGDTGSVGALLIRGTDNRLTKTAWTHHLCRRRDIPPDRRRGPLAWPASASLFADSILPIMLVAAASPCMPSARRSQPYIARRSPRPRPWCSRWFRASALGHPARAGFATAVIPGLSPYFNAPQAPGRDCSGVHPRQHVHEQRQLRPIPEPVRLW